MYGKMKKKFRVLLPAFPRKCAAHSNTVVQFSFAIPAHNGNLKRGSLLSQSMESYRNWLSAASMKGILTAI
jgi:hypothetical protein